MKKKIDKALCILLVLCMILCLASCGSENAAGGLGTLNMDDGSNSPDDSDGIGTLGEPSPTTEPDDPTDPADPADPAPTQEAPVPNDGYVAFSSTKQDFSFLYDAAYSAKWDDTNGATIYTEHNDSIPYVLVFCNHRGDTTGFDISNFFYFDIEEQKNNIGSNLISVSDVLTLSTDVKNIPCVLYTYKFEEYTIEMYRALDDTGDSLMLYTAKYIQGKGDPTMKAMVKAINSMQLDADYYANGGGTQSPSPQQTPAPASLSTEPYECEYFTVTKPTGWEVFYEVLDAGDGIKRLCTFVYDPANPNNMFFFVQAMEPFFVSESAKQAWLTITPAYYSNSPVISGDPSAEAALRQWGNVFALMTAEGTKSSTYFRNYGLTEVIESKVISSSADAGTNSYVLGKVTIPGAAEQSLMIFQNTLVLMDAIAGLPSSARYYISYSNMGIVLSESIADSQFSTVRACLESFNPAGFADKYSAASGTARSKIALPETDISMLP